jgi:septum formation protein
MNYPIVLASDSFLKKFVLEKSHLEFLVDAADIDEQVFDSLPVGKRVVELSKEKCKKVAARKPDCIVISADTLAVYNGQAYGKPANLEDAYDMAMTLSGQTILAYTGVTLYHPKYGYKSDLSETEIEYQNFTLDDLKRLFKDNHPTRMATGLGIFIDAPGFTLVKSISGSFTGALGLPMELVYDFLFPKDGSR